MPASGPVRLIEPRRFEDARGWFSEVYSEQDFTARGIDCRFVQDNHSLSRARFTLRGLHFQAPPHEQAKLVRCIAGSVFDVAVDIRPGSPTFAQWVGVELSAGNGRQLFVPSGFAHGFLTLEPDCEVTYKVSAGWNGEADRAIRWDDAAIGIAWPLPVGVTPILSAKDAAAPTLAESDTVFAYDGAPLTALDA